MNEPSVDFLNCVQIQKTGASFPYLVSSHGWVFILFHASVLLTERWIKKQKFKFFFLPEKPYGGGGETGVFESYLQTNQTRPLNRCQWHLLLKLLLVSCCFLLEPQDLLIAQRHFSTIMQVHIFQPASFHQGWWNRTCCELSSSSSTKFRASSRKNSDRGKARSPKSHEELASAPSSPFITYSPVNWESNGN